MTIEPGFPCPRCGTNAWTDCKHRKAEGLPPDRPENVDGRGISGGGRYKPHPATGNGRNFKRRRQAKLK